MACVDGFMAFDWFEGACERLITNRNQLNLGCDDFREKLEVYVLFLKQYC